MLLFCDGLAAKSTAILLGRAGFAVLFYLNIFMQITMNIYYPSPAREDISVHHAIRNES